MKLSSAHKAQLAKVTRVTLAGAMVVGSVSSALPVGGVQAAALNANKTTLSNTRPSASNVNYTINFTPTVTTTAIEAVDIEFCTTADTFGQNCTAPAGFAVVNASVASNGTASGFGGGSNGNAGTFSAPSTNIARYVTGNNGASAETNAVHTLNLGASVTNPTNPGTYFARLRTFSAANSTGALDDGTSAFAIVQSVQVEGRVLESMTFTVNGVATSTACGTGETTNVTATGTSVNFGNYVLNSPRIACQTVNTATNAQSGYSTSLQLFTAGTDPVGSPCRQTATNCTDDGAQSGISAADAIVNTGITSSIAAFGNTGVYGLGISANGTEKATAFTSASQYRGFYGSGNASEAVQVALKGSPSNGVDTYVAFKSNVPATQTAGVYKTRLMYNTLPTF